MTTWRDYKATQEQATTTATTMDHSADDRMEYEEEGKEIIMEEEEIVMDDDDDDEDDEDEGSEIEVLLEEYEDDVEEYEEEYEYIVEEEEITENDEEFEDNHQETDVDTSPPPPAETIETVAEPISHSVAVDNTTVDDEPGDAGAPEQTIETADNANDDSSAVAVSDEKELEAAAEDDVAAVSVVADTVISEQVEDVSDPIAEVPTTCQSFSEEQQHVAEDESAALLSVESNVEETPVEDDAGVESSPEREKSVDQPSANEEDTIGVAVADETLPDSDQATGAKPLVENNELTDGDSKSVSSTSRTVAVAVEEPKEADALAEVMEPEGNNNEVNEPQSATIVETEPPVADPSSAPTADAPPAASPSKIHRSALPEEKAIGWEKPDWVKSSPLKSKKNKVTNVPLPIGTGSPEKKIEWEKPNWVQAKLKATGKDLKKGIDLQSPITHVPKEADNSINIEASPLYLKPTEKGTAVRLGENLARPITFINGKAPVSSSS